MSWWLPVLASTFAQLGPAAAADCHGMTLRDVAAQAGLNFRHEHGASGLKLLPETMGAGVAWLDFDGDGALDLYVVQSGRLPPDGGEGAANRLFRNLGDGSFRDVTRTSRSGQRGYGQGVVAADYDGDGHVDLYVCNYGPDALLRNLGDGTFEEVTTAAGLGLDGWSSSAAFADADEDGDLDLYVTRYLEFDQSEDIWCGDGDSGERRYCDPTLFLGASDRFYRNEGDGTFRDATVEAGLADADGKGLGVLFTDLDDDGRPDLYVANDLTINLLYRNIGVGRFEAVSLFSGAGLNRDGKAEAGMGLAVGDVDGDLDADLVVSNFDVETNTLYVNRGELLFEDRSAESGFGPPSFNLLGFGTVMADLDRDGDLDVYVANGHIFDRPRRASLTRPQPDLLLLGDGRGFFAPAACGPAFEAREVGRGLAAADYDDDGDLDLAVVNNGGPLQLLRNDVAQGRWLGLRLIGDSPNSEAIGARVVLLSERTRQVRWITAGDSYQSTSDRRVLFGLPDGDRPHSLEVRWPDGTITFRDGAELQTGYYFDLNKAGETSRRPSSGGSRGLSVGELIALAGLLALLAVWLGAHLASRGKRAPR